MRAPDRPALGPLLITCARLLDEVAQAQVNREAGERIARPALMRLVPFLTREGIRPTELARRADITKQAVGQTLKACEAQGLVEFAADPTDGRAQLVRLTDDGEAAFRYGRSVLRYLDGQLANALGADTLDETTRGLAAMLPVLQGWIDTPPTRRHAAPEALRVQRLARAVKAAAPRSRS
jgi:DNA-binding MarR family transcriptional regulator